MGEFQSRGIQLRGMALGHSGGFVFACVVLEQLLEKIAVLLLHNIHRVDNSVNEDFLVIN